MVMYSRLRKFKNAKELTLKATIIVNYKYNVLINIQLTALSAED